MSTISIVVLDRGWVVVGKLQKGGGLIPQSDATAMIPIGDQDWYSLTDGSVVRRWGTSNGLGELAMKGPLPETVLDKLPLTKFHKDNIIMIIDCEEASWNT